MRTSTLLAALTAVASASAQGVPVGIAPSSKAPEGCQETSKSNFTIGYTLLSTMKRESAIEAGNSALECSLKNGILTDPQGRIGSVVANYQFQFDGPPPQAGAIYTGGFSVCPNSSLAIGGTTRWWKCGSGDFYNLYDRSIGGQCDEIRIVVTYEHQASSSSSAASSKTASSSGSASTSASASITSGSSNGTATATATSALGSSTASGSAASSVSTKSAGATSGSTTGNAASSSGVPPAPAAGAADSISVPGAGMFGAIIGIFGAALL